MPSWKKVITSGSAAALSSLNVTGGITGSSVLISGSTGTLFSSNVDTLILTGSMIVTGSSVITGSLNVSQGITGSLFGTASWAVSASWAPTTTTAATASFVTASNVYGPFGSNSIISASFAVSSSLASTASLANLINTTPTLASGIYPMVFVSASANGILYKYQNSSFSYNPGTDTLTLSYITSSLFGTASYARQTLSASFASTASYVNTLNQSVIITGSLAVGTSSLGPYENTLTLGARDGASEGGQIGFNAPGGTYTSASFIDNWQNKARILKGNNTTSTALIAQWDIHTTQMQLPGYTAASSFPGTATANLAVDSSGNVITVSTSGGSVFPYTGNAVITGSLTTTGIIYAQPNGGMYFQGGDDAALYDINVVNTMGIYGVQNSTVGAIKLGSNGPVLYGSGSNLGIGTTTPNSGALHINGGVFASSFTGSLLGTASYATQALTSSFATTASFITTAQTASFVTASNVYGPYGSNSIISASYAVSSSTAVTSSFALTSSYAINQTISGSINNVDYIDFNTGSAEPAWKSGRVYWNNTDGALSVYNAEADISLQVGQENWVRAYNASGVLVTNGTAVRLVGSHGDAPEIQLARSTQVSGSVTRDNQILGIATHDIEINSFGYITTFGLVKGLNTSAFADGDRLYVSSSAGQLTKIAPVAPYEIIPAAIVVKASPGGSGILYVQPQQPVDFTDLSSVEIGDYTYGDILTYIKSGSTGVWKHTNQLSGSYGLTGSLNATSLTGSLFGTSSWASNALTSSNIQGGTANYIPLWNTATSLSSSAIYQSTGNVGIGTTTPNAKLDVNGNTVITGSLQISSSIFQYSNNAAIISGSTANIASFPTSSYMAGFFDFVASSGLNARAGTVFTVWNGASLEFTETSTNDIGTTTNLILSASLSGANVLLQGTSLSGSWNVKTLTRMI